MPLHLYNTLTRRKEKFHKSPGELVTMYVCGPTVYKPSHIGHMVGPIIFDTVKRYLVYRGYQVKWVVNITDVDDKLIVRANELKTTVKELAEKMTADYHVCLQKLNVTGIDTFPRATEHIAGMIAMMDRLIKKGYAYAAEGDVYFDITKDADYGKLCNRDPEQLEAGARIEITGKKRNPGDFALWKAAKPGEPSWDSPWGPGRPGWHIECSVMSQALLGETLDIHGGGLDLQFPHHENELAQSESDTDKPFAQVWMHNGLLKLSSGKMAGSIGNVLNVVDALKHVSGEILRFFILNTHYRSPIDLGEWDPKNTATPIPSGLESARKAFHGFIRFAERFQRITGKSFYSFTAPASYSKRTFLLPELSQLHDRFIEFMDDDVNTGGATAVLFELLTTLNKFADNAKLEDAASRKAEDVAAFTEGAKLLFEIGSLMGLFFEAPAEATLGGDDKLVAGLMQLLIDLRNNLRTEAKLITEKTNPTKKALFEQTDLIRKRLGDMGIVLEDRGTGTDWRLN
jgi:cysteinyl-tRNA synthetase